MAFRKLKCILVSAMLATASARASEIAEVKNALGPEGPLYVGGSLYFVGWVSGTL
jgi:hypothetical protein